MCVLAVSFWSSLAILRLYLGTLNGTPQGEQETTVEIRDTTYDYHKCS